MRHKLIIWGASGHALVIADIIRLRGEYEIIGFLDDISPESCDRIFLGAPVFRTLDEVMQLGVKYCILGVGDCEARLNLSKLACSRGFSLATAIHPLSIVATGVSIGVGSVVVAGAVINPGARIGENVIINSCASVDHECILEDGVHISPGVHLGGRVVVGRATWVGIGAIIKDRVRIGEGSLIGAGAVVVNDIPDGVVAYGVPARVVREVEVV